MKTEDSVHRWQVLWVWGRWGFSGNTKTNPLLSGGPPPAVSRGATAASLAPEAAIPAMDELSHVPVDFAKNSSHLGKALPGPQWRQPHVQPNPEHLRALRICLLTKPNNAFCAKIPL